jgi:hypothetical protein
MPIFMIDVHSAAAPQPANMQQVLLRMFEILLHNNLTYDSQTARRYTRFISILTQVDQQLPADASVPRDQDWDAVMNYALMRQIRMIDINKPAGESASDFSRETILRRLSTGYDQMRSALEETPSPPDKHAQPHPGQRFREPGPQRSRNGGQNRAAAPGGRISRRGGLRRMYLPVPFGHRQPFPGPGSIGGSARDRSGL